MTDSPTDADLVAVARSGDKEAFGLLVERYEHMAVRIARGVLGEPDIARELAQEAIVQAYLSLDRLRDGSRFQSWLYGIVLNVCRGYLRDRKNAMFSLEAMAGGLAFDAVPFTGVEPGPEEMPAEVAASQAPIIAGLLRRADSAPTAEENGAVDPAGDLTAEAEAFQPSPGVMESPAEGVIPAEAQPPASQPPVELQDNDPLGLGSGAMAATPSTAEQVPLVSLPVVLQPGQEEIHIPLEVRAGEQVQRYRLRLHISLGPED